VFAADKGVFLRGLDHRYPVPECPGPSAPLAPKAGALWREPPFALVGVVEPVVLAPTVPPELVGALTLGSVKVT
jgi:hypothetical protein